LIGYLAELVQELEAQRALMIAVATGGPRIQAVNTEYTQRRSVIAKELAARGLREPSPYGDLWGWYGKWSSGDLPSYQSRRTYVSELYQPLIDRLLSGAQASQVFDEPTGWVAIDRDVGEMRHLLEEAQTPVQFQAVGLFCREVLISLAQGVYDPHRHPTVDGVAASATDGKREYANSRVVLSGWKTSGIREGYRANRSLCRGASRQWQSHEDATTVDLGGSG
jgi:hypothetical protein